MLFRFLHFLSDCDKVLQDTMHALFKSEQQLMETANEDSNTQVEYNINEYNYV